MLVFNAFQNTPKTFVTLFNNHLVARDITYTFLLNELKKHLMLGHGMHAGDKILFRFLQDELRIDLEQNHWILRWQAEGVIFDLNYDMIFKNHI